MPSPLIHEYLATLIPSHPQDSEYDAFVTLPPSFEGLKRLCQVSIIPTKHHNPPTRLNPPYSLSFILIGCRIIDSRRFLNVTSKGDIQSEKAGLVHVGYTTYKCPAPPNDCNGFYIRERRIIDSRRFLNVTSKGDIQSEKAGLVHVGYTTYKCPAPPNDCNGFYIRERNTFISDLHWASTHQSYQRVDRVGCLSTELFSTTKQHERENSEFPGIHQTVQKHY
ncbi:hypothetical protein T265_11443 [Opisthorchis viverrini]|uniref:Uncharacterized protein n=1 Tax=Opisthorchis viverrini TaxID=6198 RepID=A0A074ZXF2_OPIVI|nr:hypothetical protein T265_11443 [Opisthorchis viverrini]KER19879.1 hypothetical protein T265_11443 [Opisthorchis viverrini]